MGQAYFTTAGVLGFRMTSEGREEQGILPLPLFVLDETWLRSAMKTLQVRT